MELHGIIFVVAAVIGTTHGADLPAFRLLRANYLGYPAYGGHFHDSRVYVTSGPHDDHKDTSALRLSQTLNKIGAPHDIKTNEAVLDDGDIRYVPFNGNIVIIDAASFGPYLENRYRTPYSLDIVDQNELGAMSPLKGRQGVVRMALGKYKRADATIALWDCDHFHQARDWSVNKHLIAVDFWETPDSNCTQSSN